jgi:signal transduction histidine kinase
MFRQMKSTFAGNFVMAAVTIFALWNLVDHDVLFMWAGAVWVLTLLRIGFIARYRQVRPAEERVTRWAWSFTATTVVSGILWGSIGVLFFDPTQPFAILYVCFVLAGMLGGSVASLSNFPPAYIGFAVPAAMPFVVRAFLEGGNIYPALGAGSFLMLIINLAYSRAAYRTISDSIRLRLENITLVEQLRTEKEYAEAANRAKSTFLAAVSHDLRQPAHALGLVVSALFDVVNQPAQAMREHVLRIGEQMQASLNGLSGLLRGLLDISRLDAGSITPEVTDIDLGDYLQRFEKQFGPIAERKELLLRVAPTSLWCRSDPAMLERILGNLISNAIRYTGRGSVLVGCRRRGNDVLISVCDTGIGIPSEHHKDVFSEFFQLHNPARDRERGLGLGLAIVQRSARLLGHAVSVKSTPNRGSTFSIVVPRTTPKAIVKKSPPPAVVMPNAPRTVLVIDDEAPIRKAVIEFLAPKGFHVAACGTIEELQDCARLYGDDVFVVLADYRLADGVTGDAAIDAARQALGRPVPAFLITGDTSPERIRQATSSGHRLLHKPIDPAQLMTMLRELQSAVANGHSEPAGKNTSTT